AGRYHRRSVRAWSKPEERSAARRSACTGCARLACPEADAGAGVPGDPPGAAGARSTEQQPLAPIWERHGAWVLQQGIAAFPGRAQSTEGTQGERRAATVRTARRRPAVRIRRIYMA